MGGSFLFGMGWAPVLHRVLEEVDPGEPIRAMFCADGGPCIASI